jgi:hypothetical protein
MTGLNRNSTEVKLSSSPNQPGNLKLCPRLGLGVECDDDLIRRHVYQTYLVFSQGGEFYQLANRASVIGNACPQNRRTIRQYLDNLV